MRSISFKECKKSYAYNYCSFSNSILATWEVEWFIKLVWTGLTVQYIVVKIRNNLSIIWISLVSPSIAFLNHQIDPKADFFHDQTISITDFENFTILIRSLEDCRDSLDCNSCLVSEKSLSQNLSYYECRFLRKIQYLSILM